MPCALLAYWIHRPHPFLFEFSDGLGLRYYGLAYILGFFGGAWLFQAYARAHRSLLPAAKVSDLLVALVIGVMAGGRLGYFLLYHPATFWENPLEILRVWEGGMASHGGFVGVTLALAWFARREKIPFLHLGDLIVTAAPLGLLLGRLANFLNGELWGKPATVPWAVIFEASGGGSLPRHPSQLYEAALEGALLLAYLQWRFWKSDVTRTHPGRLAGEFLLAYAAVRVFGELFREPDASLILGLNRGIFYSLFLVAGGLFLLLRHPTPLPPAKK